jgi:heavy metal efflux system protein
MKRLAVAVPLSLLAIGALLYASFRRLLPTLVILAVVPFVLVGAATGLRLLGEPFSVSSAVGCIAVLGQVVLGGVVVCSRIDERTSTREGLFVAFRPVVATTSLALLGLVPAAMSHAMGSETQRPFAIAIIAGLVAAAPVVLLLVPLAYGRRIKEAS